MKRVLFGLTVGAAAVLAAGCAQTDKSPSAAPTASAAMAAPGATRAAAPLASKSGTNTGGRVTFEQQQGGGVMVVVAVTGLPPGTTHGFHIHEKGDCSAPDGMSAGGHFNPGAKPHGQMSMPEHHAGDMNNLTADSAGNARAQFVMSDVTVGAGPNSVVGRSVIVHKDPDDYRTQPTGNAGGRIACGVIAAT
ncbi:superoxide dismutase family protein [Cupriavidus pauculus]|uniref:Superoxide dismutase [Cu-Zn] n=1 Tax=Cupriavidus pauculus TaxID=82633 RepID=A0A2N5CH38_9BURK|nr:superoxide dismutase family protein [Cupriavidus pauculus]PLQ01511.1 superoxide dismutase [Cupriavidus pauculus]